jgi:two-component system NtrC family sensor kinase
MTEKGTVTITTTMENNWIDVQVADNGHGITPEHLRHIFEPFFTTKAIGVGTGLGLSVTYNIIKAHGGTIDVASVVGSGTTFTLQLPVD